MIVSVSVTLHPFKAWLRGNGATQDWAAGELGLSRLTLHRNFTGRRIMDLGIKLKVEDLTKGEVSALQICGWEIDRLQETLDRAAA